MLNKIFYLCFVMTIAAFGINAEESKPVEETTPAVLVVPADEPAKDLLADASNDEAKIDEVLPTVEVKQEIKEGATLACGCDDEDEEEVAPVQTIADAEETEKNAEELVDLKLAGCKCRDKNKNLI